jgi:hypothetical protein
MTRASYRYTTFAAANEQIELPNSREHAVNERASPREIFDEPELKEPIRDERARGKIELKKRRRARERVRDRNPCDSPSKC